MLLVSFHFSKFAFLFYFTLEHYSVQAFWQHSQQSKSTSSLNVVCRMNNRERFRSFLDPILVPRIVGTPSHDEVAEHLSRTLSALGFTTEWDRFEEITPFGNKTFMTLIATHDPNAPKRLVLACHYDSKILEGENFIGATDSAVPCAMLLELASTIDSLSDNRKKRNVTLQLIFFDGEEALIEWSETDSLYGSRHLASKWNQEYSSNISQSSFEIKKEIDRIELFILLDLLGAPNPLFYNFDGYSSTGAFMEMVKIERKLREINCLHQLPPMFQPRTVYSRVEDDHVPFLNLNVPVLHIIPIPFPSVWHTVSDNADVLDYRTIENLNSILRVFVLEYHELVP